MLNLLLSGLAGLLLGALAVPAAVLLTQVLLYRRRPQGLAPQAAPARHTPLAVLMPAHNEAAVIEQTLRVLLPQLGPQDRLLVVADNCSDDTAALARALGAEVTERSNLQDRGKGFALAHGLAVLAVAPPPLVVIVDADCLVTPGALEHLAQTVLEQQRPAQALYLMTAAPDAGPGRRLAAFAWRVRNEVRPGGWQRMGGPCQLMGTGMAFTWDMLAQADIGNASIVEDMKLGLDLARAGTAPVFCPAALVTSQFPDSDSATRSQRTRWEHGHLETLLTLAPRLALRGVLRADARLLGMALDLCVPPLALLAGLLSLGVVLSAVGWAVGGPAWPLLLAGGSLLAFAVAALRAWRLRGRDLVSGRELLGIPGYALAKLPLYLRFITRRQKAWVRTDRQ